MNAKLFAVLVSVAIFATSAAAFKVGQFTSQNHTTLPSEASSVIVLPEVEIIGEPVLEVNLVEID